MPIRTPDRHADADDPDPGEEYGLLGLRIGTANEIAATAMVRGGPSRPTIIEELRDQYPHITSWGPIFSQLIPLFKRHGYRLKSEYRWTDERKVNGGHVGCMANAEMQIALADAHDLLDALEEHVSPAGAAILQAAYDKVTAGIKITYKHADEVGVQRAPLVRHRKAPVPKRAPFVSQLKRRERAPLVRREKTTPAPDQPSVTELKRRERAPLVRREETTPAPDQPSVSQLKRRKLKA